LFAAAQRKQGAGSKPMSKFFSLIVILGAVILFTATVRDTAGMAALQDTKGKNTAALYKQHCAKCHGADGKGIESLKSVDVPDFTDAKWQAARTDKQIIEGIAEGKNIMPGFKDAVSKEEINALAQHVRAFAPATKKK
jgi:mono/diheme cytochrome c family protein